MSDEKRESSAWKARAEWLAEQLEDGWGQDFGMHTESIPDVAGSIPVTAADWLVSAAVATTKEEADV